MSVVLMDNKAAVLRFNHEVIEAGRTDDIASLVDPAFVNHSAPPGMDDGIGGMLHTFNAILRPALADMHVEVLDQVAEGDKVTTRKRITGTHAGDFMGIPATGKYVSIDVIDMVTLRDGRYLGHWGVNNLAAVLGGLRQA